MLLCGNHFSCLNLKLPLQQTDNHEVSFMCVKSKVQRDKEYKKRITNNNSKHGEGFLPSPFLGSLSSVTFSFR
ncbi:CLUMA_CG019245, isoform A [Clunio marinus]|uniref:CLUMA_CG019245, isoform A n=1 Tax=Clunio marinus TaxID=568069 RepID=A0A1J1J4T8_9DIPT|nr:CLUMA_CG019245, isoform A [Clunio marinus]